MFKPPATVKYPFEKTYTPANVRGLIGYNEAKCIFCLKCEDVCPPNAIVFDTNPDDGVQKYHYNPYLCIYCGECVRACPEPGHDGALWQEENVASPGIASQNINESWGKLQCEAAANREAWKIKKRELAKQKKEEQAAQTASNTEDNSTQNDS